LATRSGRGGTTGRRAGWPAKGRFGGGLAGGGPPAAGAGAPARAGSAGREGRGTIAGLGTGAPGAAGALLLSAGSGWRGPDRICPGFGAAGAAGTGLAGAAAPGRPGAKTMAGGVCAVAGGTPGAGLGPGVAVGAGAGGAGCNGGWTGRPAKGGRKRDTTLCSSREGALLAGASGSFGSSERWASTGDSSVGASVLAGESACPASAAGSGLVTREPLVSGSPCAAWDVS